MSAHKKPEASRARVATVLAPRTKAVRAAPGKKAAAKTAAPAAAKNGGRGAASKVAPAAAKKARPAAANERAPATASKAERGLAKTRTSTSGATRAVARTQKTASEKPAAARQAARPRKAGGTPHAAPRAALIDAALGLPGAWEDHPWGHTVAKVGKKMFLVLSGEGEPFSLSVKLPESGEAALTMFSWAEPTGYGMGKSGWVTATFQDGDDVPVPLLLEWLDESYRAIAPARVRNATAPERLSKPK